MATSRWPTAAVLAAWCLLAVGDSLHAGYYSTVALACVLAGFAALVAVVAVGVPLASVDRRLLAIPLAICLVRAVDDPTRPFLYVSGAGRTAIETMAVLTAAAAVALLFVPDAWQRRAWLVVLALGAATGVVIISVITDPGIDVWDLLQQSSVGLLHGDDMYRQHWSHSTGLQNVYPYLPLSTVILAPFRWLLGDVRYGLVLAIVATAWLVSRQRGPQAAPLAALLVVAPGWVLLVNRSWSEPLIVLALTATLLLIRGERPGLAVVTLAIGLACKQHLVLLLPLFAIWRGFGLRRVVYAAVLAALAVAPWVIAGPRAFWHDAVHANLSLPVKSSALDVPALVQRHGSTIGFWLLVVVLLAAYAVAAARLPRTPAALALACALVMWGFDLANKQTYFNHYWLPLDLLVLALAMSNDRTVSSPAPGPAEAGTERSARPGHSPRS